MWFTIQLIVVQTKEQLARNRSIYHMFCDVCGEDLGPQKMYWAEEHLKNILLIELTVKKDHL
jgi:hypothetical protein